MIMKVTLSLLQRGMQPKEYIPLTPNAKILKKPPRPAVPFRGPEAGNPPVSIPG
jgi:hypothetical protein